MFTIYHNPRCKKSRAGLQYLQSKTDEITIVEYLKNPLTEEKLKELMKKLGKRPFEMVRTQEADYKKNYKGKELSDDEWIKIMVENPKLIKRPIVEKGDKAVWGDPAEELEVFFQ